MRSVGWDISASGLHPSLFCKFRAVRRTGSNVEVPEYMRDVEVVGRIISSSVTSTANWESSLEGNDLDSALSGISAMAQTGSYKIGGLSDSDRSGSIGRTLVGVVQSRQVWRGEEPLSPNITVEFLALRDAGKEVEEAVQMLHLLKAPRLNNGLRGSMTNLYDKLVNGKQLSEEEDTFFGEIPFDIVVSIFNQRFNSVYVIESISEDEEEIRRDKNGYRLQQEVAISLKSVLAINRGLSGSGDIKTDYFR